MTFDLNSVLAALASVSRTQQLPIVSKAQAGPAQSPAKTLAYGAPADAANPTSGIASPVNAGSLFRVERGAPLLRAGKPVFATPQFKALTIYSLTSKTAQLPTTSVQTVSVTYPTKTK